MCLRRVCATMSFMDIYQWRNRNAKNKSDPVQNDASKVNETEQDKSLQELIFRITERLDQNLTTENLYRKSGNKEHILSLRKKNLNKVRFDKEDVHDLASWLKMILTGMEEPLLPKQMFETLKQDASKSQIKEELNKLDDAKRKILDHVMRHILRVVDKKEANKMSKENMCIVWAPVVCYPLENRSDVEKCIEIFGALMEIYAEEPKEDNRNKRTEKKVKGKAPQPPHVERSTPETQPEGNEMTSQEEKGKEEKENDPEGIRPERTTEEEDSAGCDAQAEVKEEDSPRDAEAAQEKEDRLATDNEEVSGQQTKAEDGSAGFKYVTIINTTQVKEN